MECHAWMVTIPLGNRKHVAALGKASVTKRKPAICVPYKREYFLNPGHPQTKEYLMSLVREVVERYDVEACISITCATPNMPCASPTAIPIRNTATDATSRNGGVTISRK